ncbi:MAG: ParB/RepB/Spo0J family partition protein, partial [Oscillospiraceae bacterium]|nr:ParB/RepB/Spo0J family partition protein [Oscillospiraceae bacterium]
MALLRKKEGVVGKVLSLPIDSISPNPNQPRRRFAPEELRELADSIRALGILQPLTVRATPDGGWQLIAGERRLRAAQLAGLTHVPCIPAQCDDRDASLLALVENLQRSDLDFWEEAQALYRLMHQYDISQEACARQLGKSQSAIANKLRLLRLPEDTLRLLRDNGFTERHARALLRLKDTESQEAAGRWVVERGLTVAKTEEYVDSLLLQEQKVIKRRPTFILKDVRLFLNTVDRGVSMMRSAGVEAQCGREDTGEAILLTIRIPKRARPAGGELTPRRAAPRGEICTPASRFWGFTCKPGV